MRGHDARWRQNQNMDESRRTALVRPQDGGSQKQRTTLGDGGLGFINRCKRGAAPRRVASFYGAKAGAAVVQHFRASMRASCRVASASRCTLYHSRSTLDECPRPAGHYLGKPITRARCPVRRRDRVSLMECTECNWNELECMQDFCILKIDDHERAILRSPEPSRADPCDPIWLDCRVAPSSC